MSRFVSLQLGKIIQNCGLNATNPLQSITWYSSNGETVDDDGMSTQTYTQYQLQARIQPVSQDTMFKLNLEFGRIYKRFFVLTDNIKTVDRNVSSTGDFFLYNDGVNSLYYRVLMIPNDFLTTWMEVIAQQTDTLGV